ncbi:hypothetical protein [Streptomyces goshikiensis]
MAKTIYVRGEGGAVIAMDLPLPEGIAERFEAGLLVRVHSDGSPYAPAPSRTPAAPDPDPSPDGDGPKTPAPDPGPASPRGARPGINAPKSEWIAYVVAAGLHSAEDAANFTKADLIDMAS